MHGNEPNIKDCGAEVDDIYGWLEVPQPLIVELEYFEAKEVKCKNDNQSFDESFLLFWVVESTIILCDKMRQEA